MESDDEVEVVAGGGDGEPTQVYMTQVYTVCGLLATLQRLKRGGRAKHWEDFTPAMSGVGEGRKVVLMCGRCQQPLSAKNPSDLAKKHLLPGERCQNSKPEGEAAAEGKRARGTMLQHVVRALPLQAQENAVEKLCLFFYKHNVALHLIEAPDLVAAFAAAGISLPSRYQLSTTRLDKASTKVEEARDAALASVPHVQVATDGWSSQACESGAALINCMVLLPDAGSLFLDVINGAGQKKDKGWVANEHIALLDQATKGDKDRQNSVIMDNTKTNRAAMAMIKEQRPQVITLGCQVEALIFLVVLWLLVCTLRIFW